MPESPAEVWEKYLPRLAEAKEKDREEITRAFLPVVIPLGKFEIVPVTIERLLWLEQIKSPFITGGRDVKKEDVLAFLWICSPDFRVGFKAGKRFCLRHTFLNWKKYAKLIHEMMTDMMDQLGIENSGDKKSGQSMQYDWLPTFVDGFASQYHWSEKEIMDLPIYRVGFYATAMMNRLADKKTAKFARRQDKVKAEYLKEVNSLNKKKEDG